MCRGHGWWLFGVGALLLFALLGPGLWGFGGMAGMMGRYWGPGYRFGPAVGWYGPFVTALFIVLVGGGIFLLVRFLANRNSGTHAPYLGRPYNGHGMQGHSAAAAETPVDILKKRYARGEITKEEFDTIKRDLQ